MAPIDEVEVETESTPLLGRRALIQAAAKEVKQDFIRKVYGILALQLLLTAVIATPFQFVAPARLEAWYWLSAVAAAVVIGCMITGACFGDAVMKRFPQNFAFLSLLTVGMSVVVGFFASTFAWYSVLLSAGLAAAVFLGLTVFAYSSKADFTGIRPYLAAGILVCTLFGSTFGVLGLLGIYIPYVAVLYDLLSLFLFSFYIIYDTQRIVNDTERSLDVDDYIFAALCLYTDMVNLFIHVLSLLGKRRQ